MPLDLFNQDALDLARMQSFECVQLGAACAMPGFELRTSPFRFLEWNSRQIVPVALLTAQDDGAQLDVLITCWRFLALMLLSFYVL